MNILIIEKNGEILFENDESYLGLLGHLTIMVMLTPISKMIQNMITTNKKSKNRKIK